MITEIKRNHGAEIVCSTQITNSITKIVDDIQFTNGGSLGQHDVVDEILSRSTMLPPEIHERLMSFSDSGDAFLIISGLGLEKHDEILFLLTGVIGSPFAHRHEGDLIMAVKPNKDIRGDGGPAYYTWDAFDLHSELPYVRVPPDYLALLCVNNVAGGETLVAPISSALEKLTDKQISQLKLPQYRIRIPGHFSQNIEYAEARPVLTEYDGRYSVRVRFDGIECGSNDAKEAVNAFKDALISVSQGYELAPGSLLIVNNKTATHGRKAFEPTFASGDRELRRVYLTTDHGRFGESYDEATRQVQGF